jgi:DNA-binding ferritin-like protein
MSIVLSKFIFGSSEDNYKSFARSFLNEEIKKYGNSQYAELAVLLGAIRGVSLIHQQNHWISKGEKYYGDHLLFMRLYETVDNEIDKLAEKTVGLSTSDYVCLVSQVSHLAKFVELFKSELSENTTIKSSYQAELFFMALCTIVFDQLKSLKLLTPGLEQTLGTILETHEANIYLLKQRFQD